MAILRGFPPSNTISPGPRIATECEDCKQTSYFVYGRNSSGSDSAPQLDSNERWIQLCNKCADNRKEKASL